MMQPRPVRCTDVLLAHVQLPRLSHVMVLASLQTLLRQWPAELYSLPAKHALQMQ